MRLIGWNVFKEAISIGYEITEELMDYVKGLNYVNKELDIFTDCLYLLCMKEGIELESEFKKWDDENRFLTSQKADDLLYLINNNDYPEIKKEIMRKYITVYQR
ncbi:MAG: hypothetical protein JW791_03235, partial [Nanoarchaeota archaeon]|nr:hypothetical protein [Nanoarchaeota archaeon]